ncbi:MAG: C1 family peptidase [Clostridia bacterium]
MKEIKKESLENIENEYKKDITNTIARRALVKSKISDLTKVNEQTEFTRNMFSINLKTLPVTNQKRSGRCWIFAGCNVIREKIAEKYNLKDFEISQNYIAFYDKLEKCNYLLESIISLKNSPKDDRTLDYLLSTGVQDGGQWDLFVNIVNKYGVVPKNAFPETFQSSNTNEIDGLLNKYIRKFAYDIRNNEENIEARKEKSIKEIYSILCSCFGIPPKTFTFEYVDKDKKYNIIKDLTPMKFYKEIVPINLDDYVSIINSPTDDKPFGKTYTVDYLGNVIEGNEVLYLNLEIERLKELAINQLKDGETVWFGSDCGKAGDREGGVWDDATFDIDTLFKINSQMSKGAMLDTRESAMNHAMVITGVNLDNETPTKWKIENSWGDEVADKGYYVATDSWFTKYVYQVVVNKKYLTKEERESLKAEKIRLKPWDPMGTLA